jgi:hypothetical protein
LPAVAPLVIMFAVIDGLMRLPRLAKAGKWVVGGYRIVAAYQTISYVCAWSLCCFWWTLRPCLLSAA